MRLIVYVESDFVLELALDQEQHAAADTVVHLAETGRLRLCVPSFALAEPFSKLWYNGLERRRLATSIEGHVRELARSGAPGQIVLGLQTVPEVLVRIRSRRRGDSGEGTAIPFCGGTGSDDVSVMSVVCSALPAALPGSRARPRSASTP